MHELSEVVMPKEDWQLDRPMYSLVFPVFNPGPALAGTWRRIEEFFLAARGAWELVFVCDGCTDDAPDRLRQWSVRHGPGIQVIAYPHNQGKGHAVYQGLAAARGQWRIFTDIDLAYGFEDVQRLAERLRSGADAVVASRLHPDSRSHLPAALQAYMYRRHLQSKFFSFVVHWLLPLSVRDTQAGLKGFSARLLEQVLPHVRCRGFEFDCELLTACAWLGIPVEEVPVAVRYESGTSTTGVTDVLHMLRGVLRIRQAWKNRPRPLAMAAPEKPGLPLAS
jgi:hypothetical protein